MARDEADSKAEVLVSAKAVFCSFESKDGGGGGDPQDLSIAALHPDSLSICGPGGGVTAVPLTGGFTFISPLPRGLLLDGAKDSGPCLLLHPLEASPLPLLACVSVSLLVPWSCSFRQMFLFPPLPEAFQPQHRSRCVFQGVSPRDFMPSASLPQEPQLLSASVCVGGRWDQELIVWSSQSCSLVVTWSPGLRRWAAGKTPGE